jgi:hypothetical protein
MAKPSNRGYDIRSGRKSPLCEGAVKTPPISGWYKRTSEVIMISLGGDDS